MPVITRDRRGDRLCHDISSPTNQQEVMCHGSTPVCGLALWRHPGQVRWGRPAAVKIFAQIHADAQREASRKTSRAVIKPITTFEHANYNIDDERLPR